MAFTQAPDFNVLTSGLMLLLINAAFNAPAMTRSGEPSLVSRFKPNRKMKF